HEFGGPGHGAHAPRELRELRHDLLVEIGDHALDRAKLIPLQREDEAQLEALEYADVQVRGGLTAEHKAGAHVPPHAGELEVDLGANDVLVVRDYHVRLIDEIEREPLARLLVALLGRTGALAANALELPRAHRGEQPRLAQREEAAVEDDEA